MARQGVTDDRLARVALFEGLSKRQLAHISGLMTSSFSAGKVLRVRVRSAASFGELNTAASACGLPRRWRSTG
jgi:hypothetical protein